MDTRPRKPVSFSLDPRLLDRLEVWITKQEFPPVKTHVVETAIREFLDNRERLAAMVAKKRFSAP
ncbi:MAG: hypothetical protein EHM35_13620 [Planctomycetaceae bacterium]|nr:MAG: hypothetical protein EHM35_13620 [Planctomycetaceae bacterium]